MRFFHWLVREVRDLYRLLFARAEDSGDDDDTPPTRP